MSDIVVTVTPCLYCQTMVRSGQEHDCRQFQISILRGEVAALRAQIESLSARAAMSSIPQGAVR